MSLRRRLALTTTSLLVAGYIVFSLISLNVLDNSLRSAMESKLSTIAQAASEIVDDRDGKPAIDSDDIAQIDALHTSDEHVGIYDNSGALIFGDPMPIGEAASRPIITRVRAIHRGDHLGSVSVWRDATWILTVRRTATIAFVAVGGTLAAIAFFFSGLYARAILTPLERVAQLAERIETSDLSQRINARGSDEIGRVCASFDRMLERLQASFDAERRFVSDASHELRAPLAVVRAETDLALRRERSSSEYRAALESVAREAMRLEELVDSLLQTMRREATLNAQTVDVAELGRELARRLRTATAAFTVHCSRNDAHTHGDRRSLERAFCAIAHNAATHGGGEISFSAVVDEDSVVVSIADGGPGFSAEALAHATERFWRGDSARPRGSTGLGLSIARTLIEAHGGTLMLSNGTQGGAVVTITLPRAGVSVVPA